MKQQPDNCICGNHVYHTKECKRKQRRDRHNKQRRLQRAQLKVEHKCIWCKQDVEPIITYPQFCAKHKKIVNQKKNLK